MENGVRLFFSAGGWNSGCDNDEILQEDMGDERDGNICKGVW